MTNKYMKRCSTSLVVKVMKIKNHNEILLPMQIDKQGRTSKQAQDGEERMEGA